MEGLKKGEIQALVAQNPKKMGHEAVKALVAKMKGETVPDDYRYRRRGYHSGKSEHCGNSSAPSMFFRRFSPNAT